MTTTPTSRDNRRTLVNHRLRRPATVATTMIAALMTINLTATAVAASAPTPQGVIAAAGSTTSPDHDYGGRLSDSNAYIGLSMLHDQVLAYVCDGDSAHNRPQTIGAWFRGRAHSGAMLLTSREGARLSARILPHAISGTVTLADGKTRRFTARLAHGQIRFLFATHPARARATRTPGLPRDGTLVAGWIRLADGSERGTRAATFAPASCPELLGAIKYISARIQADGSNNPGATNNAAGDLIKVTNDYLQNCS
jgi:hypothetical protein